MFCGVSDLVGGMSDTCGDKGVTVSADGWDSVSRGCEAVASMVSGSPVGPVAIGGAGIGPVCGLEVASAGEVAAEAPSAAGERDSAAVGPVEDSVAGMDGMGMTEIFGCLSSCADMSVGGLSDGTAGSGAPLRDGAGGLLWAALECVSRFGAAMPGAACGLSAVAAGDWGLVGISAAGMAGMAVLLNACRSEPLLLSVARVIGVLPPLSLRFGSAPWRRSTSITSACRARRSAGDSSDSSQNRLTA